MNQFLTKYTVSAKFQLGTAKTFVAAAVDIVNDNATIVDHGFDTGDVVGLTTDGALPTGLSVDTAYYIINVNASTVAFATSRANAFAGTKINITAIGTGTNTALENAIGIVRTGVIIPKGHMIVLSAYDCPTTCASSGTDGGTMAIHVEAANDIVTATAISTGTTWDNVSAMVAGTPVSAATAVKCTVDRELIFTLATNAFSAGEVVIYLDVVAGEV